MNSSNISAPFLAEIGEFAYGDAYFQPGAYPERGYASKGKTVTGPGWLYLSQYPHFRIAEGTKATAISNGSYEGPAAWKIEAV